MIIFNSIIAILFASRMIDGYAEFPPILKSHDAGSEREELLVNFLIDVKANSFEKLNYRDMLVIGKMRNYLQAAEVILRSGSTPYYITTKEYSQTISGHEIGASNIAIFFTDGLNETNFDVTFAKLPKNYNCQILIISLEKTMKFKSIKSIIDSAAHKHKLYNLSFANFDGGLIKIYRRHLSVKCLVKLRMINTWRPGIGFKKKEIIFGIEKNDKTNFHGCTLKVSTYNIAPTMMLKRDEHNVWKVASGVEGHYIETIAKRLNASLSITFASVLEKLHVSADGKLRGIVGDVVNGDADFGIGQLRMSPERKSVVDFTVPYNHECMVWIVPYAHKLNSDIIFNEFSPTIWMLIFLSILLYCLVIWGDGKLRKGKKSMLTVLDIVAVALTRPVTSSRNLRLNIIQKFHFIIYLNYCYILTTAYSTSLASILTTTIPKASINDENGIIAAKFRIGGTETSLALLSHQILPNTTRCLLINRYEVVPSVDKAFKWLTESKDFAYLKHLSTVKYKSWEYAKAGKSLDFYPLADACVLSFHTIIAIGEGSPLIDQINDIILNLREAGMNVYWAHIDNIPERDFGQLPSQYRTLSEFRAIFQLYLLCLIPAGFVFAAELFVSNFRKFN